MQAPSWETGAVHIPAVLQVCPLPQSAAVHFIQLSETRGQKIGRTHICNGSASNTASNYLEIQCSAPGEEQDALVATAVQTPLRQVSSGPQTTEWNTTPSWH